MSRWYRTPPRVIPACVCSTESLSGYITTHRGAPGDMPSLSYAAPKAIIVCSTKSLRGYDPYRGAGDGVGEGVSLEGRGVQVLEQQLLVRRSRRLGAMTEITPVSLDNLVRNAIVSQSLQAATTWRVCRKDESSTPCPRVNGTLITMAVGRFLAAAHDLVRDSSPRMIMTRLPPPPSPSRSRR
jgi:hypothetical protein